MPPLLPFTAANVKAIATFIESMTEGIRETAVERGHLAEASSNLEAGLQTRMTPKLSYYYTLLMTQPRLLLMY